MVFQNAGMAVRCARDVGGRKGEGIGDLLAKEALKKVGDCFLRADLHFPLVCLDNYLPEKQNKRKPLCFITPHCNLRWNDSTKQKLWGCSSVFLSKDSSKNRQMV